MTAPTADPVPARAQALFSPIPGFYVDRLDDRVENAGCAARRVEAGKLPRPISIYVARAPKYRVLGQVRFPSSPRRVSAGSVRFWSLRLESEQTHDHCFPSGAVRPRA